MALLTTLKPLLSGHRWTSLLGVLGSLLLPLSLVYGGGGCKSAILPMLLLLATGVAWLATLLLLRTRGLAAWAFLAVLGALLVQSWL